MISAGTTRYPSTSDWMRVLREPSHRRCHECHEPLSLTYMFTSIPELLALEFSGQSPSIDALITIEKDRDEFQFELRGVIYFGAGHFTSRLIGQEGLTWYHDGVVTGAETVYEGLLPSLTDLSSCRGKEASVAVYVLRDSQTSPSRETRRDSH